MLVTGPPNHDGNQRIASPSTKETLMNLQRLRSVLGKGTQHLGDIVFWQLADARVDRSTLESLWRDAGLDAALLPEEPTAERALKQAVREAQVGQRDRLIRLGLDNEDEIVFAIVRESHDDAGNVTYVQEARVRLDRTSEAINSDVTSHDIVQAVFAGLRIGKINRRFQKSARRRVSWVALASDWYVERGDVRCVSCVTEPGARWRSGRRYSPDM